MSNAALTVGELKNMTLEDLVREVSDQRMLVRKLRITISMNTEKDSAKYRREKRALARMLTVISAKRRTALLTQAKSSTVSAPAAAKKSRRKAS